MHKPKKTYWQLISLVILVAVGSAATIGYALVFGLLFGFGLSAFTLTLLGLLGAAVGVLTWIVLSVA